MFSTNVNCQSTINIINNIHLTHAPVIQNLKCARKYKIIFFLFGFLPFTACQLSYTFNIRHCHDTTN